MPNYIQNIYRTYSTVIVSCSCLKPMSNNDWLKTLGIILHADVVNLLHVFIITPLGVHDK